MADKWGRWECPYEGCGAVCDDPDFPRITCCGNAEHSVLLGPPENGWRWAQKYQMTYSDVALAMIQLD